ncbi:unnamed protein product [Calicophoron daubneyi]|uniref:Bestrophin homolog n=1 Tax=Calicophoron daubneyi TaxID=300641 RepID=A0AAV2TWJ8_CALDB
MTVYYADTIREGGRIAIFIHILKKWRGSIYKVIYMDLLVYLIGFYIFDLTYRFLLNENQKRVYEGFVDYCKEAEKHIPISFLLGFFVAGVMSRWFLVFPAIPWLNGISLSVSAHLNGRNEEDVRRIRLTLMRYVNLSWVLMMRLMSDQIVERFSRKESAREARLRGCKQSRNKRKSGYDAFTPWTIGRPHIPHFAVRKAVRVNKVDGPSTSNSDDQQSFCMEVHGAGDEDLLEEELQLLNEDERVKRTFGLLITRDEINTFRKIAAESFTRNKTGYIPEYWVPIQWAQHLTLNSIKGGYVSDPGSSMKIIDELMSFRSKLQNLHNITYLIIPLAYTQVVTIAVYAYFICQMFAAQFVGHNQGGSDKKWDFYVPVFSIFSFAFLMGWYRVALCVLSPFGDDDEDFDMSDILDYNLEMSYRTVYMPRDAFPQYLDYPVESKGGNDGKSADLTKFLASVQYETEAVSRNPLITE